jgi:hypothetical protein
VIVAATRAGACRERARSRCPEGVYTTRSNKVGGMRAMPGQYQGAGLLPGIRSLATLSDACNPELRLPVDHVPVVSILRRRNRCLQLPGRQVLLHQPVVVSIPRHPYRCLQHDAQVTGLDGGHVSIHRVRSRTLQRKRSNGRPDRSRSFNPQSPQSDSATLPLKLRRRRRVVEVSIHRVQLGTLQRLFAMGPEAFQEVFQSPESD